MILVSVVLNLLGLALPIVVLQVYDRVFKNQAAETLTIMAAALVGVLILEMLLRSVRGAIAGWMAASWEHRTGVRAIRALLGASHQAYNSVSPGEHLDRLESIDRLRDDLSGQGRLALLDLPFVGLFLLLIYWIGGDLVFVPLGILCVLAALSHVFSSKLSRFIEARSKVDDRRYSFLLEILKGISTIRALGAQDFMLRRYERLQREAATQNYSVIIYNSLLQNIAGLFSTLMLATTVALAATQVMAGQLSIGGLAAITMLCGRAMQPVLRTLSLTMQAERRKTAKRQAQALLSLPQKRQEPSIRPPAGLNLVLEKLTLKSEEEEVLFGPITHSFTPGKVYGLTSKNGTNQAQFLSVLCGLSDPTEGGVWLCQSEGKHYSVSPPNIIWLPQTPQVFRGTVMENLTLFGTHSIASAMMIARQTGLESALRHLPKGYETQIDDAEQLAPNTLQLLSISRALVQKPCVLLFDEINTQFDQKEDRHFLRLLGRLKEHLIPIVTTQRPGVLRACDESFELTEGKLVKREMEMAA